MKENLYQRLGLDKTATAKQIKLAYRQMANLYHPDKNKDKGAGLLFASITKAYKILIEPEKRKHYDETGNEEFNEINSQARSLISQAMSEFIKKYIQAGQLVKIESMVSHFELELKITKQNLIKLNLTIKKMEEMNGLVKFKNDDSIYDDVLSNMMEVEENKKIKLEADINILTRVNAILNGLDNDELIAMPSNAEMHTEWYDTVMGVRP